MKNIFRFFEFVNREVKVGLLILIIAGIVALVSMYPSHESFAFSGFLEQSDEISTSDLLPSGELVNGSLNLRSDGSRVILEFPNGTHQVIVVRNEELILESYGLKLKSVDGRVNYTVQADIITYPVSFLSYLSLVLMISGTIVVNIGLLKMFSEI